MSNQHFDFSIPVHRSLLKRDLIAGISKTSLIIVSVAAIIMVLGFRQFWFLGITVVAYLILRALTKKDEYLTEILLNSIQEPDELFP